MSKVMTKEEFKKRWESSYDGGGINLNDIADCAEAWGIASCPRTMPILLVRYLVLKAAGTNDCEDYEVENFNE